MVAVGYGMAAHRYKLFPYGLIVNATSSFVAWRALEEDTLMNGVLLEEGDAPPKPTVRTLSPAAGQEAILVTGGPYQFMERCPTFGCLAWVIDRAGNVLHSWEVDYDRIVEGMSAFSGRVNPRNVYPVGMILEPDGSLYVTFHGRNIFPYQVGLARVAPDGSLDWVRYDFSHHWPHAGRDGRIFAPSMRLVEDLKQFAGTPIVTRCKTDVYDEGIRVYDGSGAVLKDYWISEIIARSDYPGLFYGVRDGCDPFHVNAVDVLTEAVAPHIPGATAGDLLVSIREPSAVALLDRDSGDIKRLVVGRTAAQHSTYFLPDGRVIAFDNQGGDRTKGGSRVVILDLVADTVKTVFPRTDTDPALLPFYADQRGHVDLSSDGRRALVATGDDSRILELDLASGAPLWSMEKTLSIRRFLDEHGVGAPHENAHFVAYGAYYVENPDFLKATAPEATQAGRAVPR
jgi:DNA-binding beta-propeller fold protein YncE